MRHLLFAALLCAFACSPPQEPEAPLSAPAAPAAATAELAVVSSPLADAQVASPLHITGIAPANWYFENQFPVRLEDPEGNVIANGPATPRVNWTENAEPKEFDATLTFTATGPATLVLEEDMPGDGETPREVRVRVVLTR
jgi:hypothetical protein